MISFFKKHKNTSLTIGALAIAVVSGIGGVFVYKKINETQSLRMMQEHISKIQTVNIRGDRGNVTNSSTQGSNMRVPVKAHSITVSPSKDNTGLTEISVEFEDKHDHEHKDSCCEACAKGLPCTGDTKKVDAHKVEKETDDSVYLRWRVKHAKPTGIGEGVIENLKATTLPQQTN